MVASGIRVGTPAITQRVYPVSHHRKLDLLDRILSDVRKPRAIVFARTRRSADRLSSRLKTRGHAVVVLHGDREQRQRERALLDFKRGRAHVLVATDIASRGIDVDHVTHVINFEAPRSPEDYVHRIGRTGRMEATGEALTLMSPEEREQVTDIERFQGRKIERVTVSGFDYGGRDEAPPRKGHGRQSHDGQERRGESSHERRREPSHEKRREPAHERRRDRAERSTESRRAGEPAKGRHHAAARAADAKSQPAPHKSAHKPATSAAPTHGRRRKINAGDRRSRRRI